MDEIKIEIEKNIPVPYARGKSGAPLPDLAVMKVGDSFLFPSGNLAHPASTIHHRVKYWALTNGLNWKFSVRSCEGGTRVWRVE